MATAKKQPSGQWKCRVYSHTDKEGKKHYRAFTASTKQEAEQMAARFSGTADRERRVDYTVMEAIKGYIHAKEGVLSPSTIFGYQSLLQYYETIGSRKLSKINSADVQLWVSELSKKLSPKSVSNIYGLLSATVALYAPEKTFRVKLPQKQKRRPVSASDAQVAALFAAASPTLKKAIGLAAYTSMRRGEICALTYGDIQGNTAHVHADMVKSTKGWRIKQTPKNMESDRFVNLPETVIKLIGAGKPDERVVPVTPDTITECFCRLRDKMGIQIRFHDLRHYFASIAAVIGVPTLYTEGFSGWAPGSGTCQRIYQNEIVGEKEKYAAMMTDYFDSVLKSMTQSMT